MALHSSQNNGFYDYSVVIETMATMTFRGRLTATIVIVAKIYYESNDITLKLCSSFAQAFTEGSYVLFRAPRRASSFITCRAESKGATPEALIVQ